MTRILIVDPDPRSLGDLQKLLAPRGYEIAAAGDGQRALDLLHEQDPDLVLVELELPGHDGLSLLDRARRHNPDLGVILMTSFGSVEDAVHAMRGGATDFLSKPFSDEQILLAVDRALERSRLQRENHDLRDALDDRLRLDNIVGTDDRMQSIFKTVKAVADTRTTVLITGESGTGKTLLARAIHAQSPRRNGPFVDVNCGALPETLLESELFGHQRGAFTGAVKDKPGKFELADGGTIFLDEIGTSSPAFQVRLLRVLQDRVIERVGGTEPVHVDVRIVLATNLDLEAAVRDGRFREDLYYRIHVINIEMPPLRERPTDIPLLAEHFVRRFALEHGRQVTGFTDEALARLCGHDWPGNVRQLENVVERAVVMSPGGVLDASSLPLAVRQAVPAAAGAAPSGEHVLPLKEALVEPEKQILAHALRVCGGNREKAAVALGINRSTLFHKLKKFGIR